VTINIRNLAFRGRIQKQGYRKKVLTRQREALFDEYTYLSINFIG
jgi:hypothetical protein